MRICPILGPTGNGCQSATGRSACCSFDDGYLPDASLNYSVRLGWSHGDQEVFSRAEMIDLFALDGVNKAAATFDMDKLGWLNQHYLKESAPESLTSAFEYQLQQMAVSPANGPDLGEVIVAQRERAQTLREMAEQSVFCFQEPDGFDEGAAKKHLRPVAAEPLLALRARLADVSDWQAETLGVVVNDTVEALELKLGKLAQPLRVALQRQSRHTGHLISRWPWLVRNAHWPVLTGHWHSSRNAPNKRD